MPRTNFDEVSKVSIPSHSIGSKNDGKAGKAIALRSRMSPIEVSDYHSETRNLLRVRRKQQLRAEILEELEDDKLHCCSRAMFIRVLFVLLVVALAWAVSVYAPDFRWANGPPL
ncbi:hypothetical protein TraAM80_02130 [Trypanosoma rangeli]|uniref:Transmembrane protein n=1 Tax=Trypanosoma rangeli TaxID=5698 RepID=A0A422NVM6_TRYRA|nr:uncharacterized protein TraAM80_02130 [Trypanosoma rangeli]RNF09521.1 hypothetical protein TraAM80_02130 [Trypanosoma rangeli]|eukprot:RNF09521.1 hypothetical protein TraAM80_02130 [Trypanosoma rangeli]